MEFLWFVILVFLVVVLIGAWPTWPYSETRNWGYTPSALAALFLIAFFFLLWFGIIAVWWPWGAY